MMVTSIISTYPEFTALELSHQQYITNFTSQFDPYSDFNFISLFSWSIDGSAEISNLNDNLVIKIPDYITGEPIVSLLGRTNINESIKELLAQSLTLKLIPQVVISELREPVDFEFIEDPDNHDYIFDLKEHAEFPDSRFKSRRKNLNRFIKEYGSRTFVRKINFHQTEKINELEHIFIRWAIERKKNNDEVQNERKAIIRLLENAASFNVECYEILIDDEIVGFSINEVLANNFVNCHFQKCLLNYSHIDVYFTNYIAKDLANNGCLYINWEQDLGVEGLRSLKQSYNPVRMLKKYIVI